MRLFIHIQHPAHVHLFKNMIWNMEKRGHKVKIAARNKGLTFKLLDHYCFNYERVGGYKSGLIGKIVDIPKKEYKLFKIMRNFNPDISMGVSDTYGNPVAKLLDITTFAFTDTELANLINILAIPFADVAFTPSCFKKDLGKKQIKYNGYHELAYLHPNYFKPNPEVLEELNMTKNDKFVVLRFISWGASHDVMLRGIKNKIDFVKSLYEYGEVFITSERELDKKLEKYRITIPPEKIHSLLHYAQLYIGEGGTMAAEAAILGTPAIHIESTSSGIATGELSGNFLELRDKYGLLYFYPDQNQALEKAISILEDNNSKKEWQRRREKLLKDKIDVTAWMTEFIERYPASFYEYREQHEIEDTKK